MPDPAPTAQPAGIDLPHSFGATLLRGARCRCPLRAALVLQVMCERIRRESPTFATRVTGFEECFGAAATGILDYVADDGEDDNARKVLLCKEGDYAQQKHYEWTQGQQQPARQWESRQAAEHWHGTGGGHRQDRPDEREEVPRQGPPRAGGA